MSGRSRILVMLPARAQADEARWIDGFVAKLARWTVLTAADPGLPGEDHGGRFYAARAWNDFREQVKESIFEHPIELVVAVGRAALARNLGMAAGWAPLVPRAGVWLGSDWIRLISGGEDRRACMSLCDLVLMAGDWNAGRLHDSIVEFAREPEQAVKQLETRFGLQDVRRGELPEPGRRGVTVVAEDPWTAAQARRTLGASAAQVLDAGGAPGPRGWNAAIARAACSRVLLLESGASVARAGLARLNEYLDADKLLAAAAATPLRARPPRGLESAQAAHMLRGKGHREHAKMIKGFGWLARRGAFSRAGSFDPGFASYRGALMDLSFRLAQAGLRVVTASDVLCWLPAPRPCPRLSEDVARLERKWSLGLTRSLLALAGEKR
jgi:hypothetical protein